MSAQKTAAATAKATMGIADTVIVIAMVTKSPMAGGSFYRISSLFLL